MLHSIEQTDPDLAAVFSRKYTGTTEHRLHYDSAYTKTSANSGVDQGCPLSTCRFAATIDPVLRFVLADICTQHDSGAQLFAFLDDWYLWIKPHCPLDIFALITAATRSVNFEPQPSEIQVWRASCQDPVPHELLDKVKITLSCLGGHLEIHEPSPIVLGEHATLEKPNNASSESPPRLPTSMRKGSTRRQ